MGQQIDDNNTVAGVVVVAFFFSDYTATNDG